MKLPKIILVATTLAAVPLCAHGATRSAGPADLPQILPTSVEASPFTKTADVAKPFKDVNVEQFDKLRGEKTSVVLDVRTKKEFDDGHIPGAINIDVNASDFDQKVAKLDKNKTYLVHCAAGVRSVKACNKLAPQDFKHLYNLEGGFKAWEKAGKSVEK